MAMLRQSFRLFRVGGIDVGIHPSWLIIFGLVTWSIATGFVPAALPAIQPAEAWAIGVAAALLLFASVLVHELAHSFVARRRGIPVHSITLFLFGGVSNLTAESKNPGTEFQIAIVGPLSSLVIAAVAYVIAIQPLDDRIAIVFAYLAFVNFALAVFNLVPGFPLDGGRVFRSLIWRATGSVRRATEIAGFVGQLVGYGFMLWGLFNFFNGDLFGGLWTAAIGWFLQNAASSSVQQLMLDQRLGSVRVADAMSTDVPAVAPGLSVAEVIEQQFLERKRHATLVTDNGRLIGIATLGDVARVPAAARQQTAVAEIMTTADALITVRSSATLREAAELLASHDFDQLPVVEDRRPVGLVTRADVLRELQVREALDIPPTRGGGGTPRELGRPADPQPRATR